MRLRRHSFGAVYFRIRPGALFRHGAISRAIPAATLPRPIVLPPARALPESKQHPGRAFPVDLVQLQPALSFHRPIPPARIVPSYAEVRVLAPMEAAAQVRPPGPVLQL